MDKTPKSKIFGFKRGAASVERSPSSNKNTVSKDEVIDLETLPLSGTTIQTSPMPAVSRINAANQLFAEQSSPQFIVGWKDGAESNDMDMNSPVRSLPIHRKIRRFPEGHVFKAPKNKQRDNREDILECIDWAKNLFVLTPATIPDAGDQPIDANPSSIELQDDLSPTLATPTTSSKTHTSRLKSFPSKSTLRLLNLVPCINSTQIGSGPTTSLEVIAAATDTNQNDQSSGVNSLVDTSFNKMGTTSLAEADYVNKVLVSDHHQASSLATNFGLIVNRVEQLLGQLAAMPMEAGDQLQSLVDRIELAATNLQFVPTVLPPDLFARAHNARWKILDWDRQLASISPRIHRSLPFSDLDDTTHHRMEKNGSQRKPEEEEAYRKRALAAWQVQYVEAVLALKEQTEKIRSIKKNIMRLISIAHIDFGLTNAEITTKVKEYIRSNTPEVNMRELAKQSTSREKDLPADENKVTETNDAIILDDSVDEIMVLCSQAVEDNLPISMQPPVIPVTSGIGENHPKPSDLHDCRTKRLKMDDTVPVESTIKKDIYSSQVKSAATRQELKTDDTVILQSNNNVEKKELSNFKPPFTMSHDKAHSRQDIKSINPVTPVRFPTKTTHKSAAQPEDLFQSILNDDEDALFGSFDFHTIDKIQNTQSKSSSLKSINSRSNILAPKLNELKSSSSKPITKEMRDQIERRRLEAKRRLLLNKKHKSL